MATGPRMPSTSVTVTRRPGSSPSDSTSQPALIGVPSGTLMVMVSSRAASVTVPVQPWTFFGSQ